MTQISADEVQTKTLSQGNRLEYKRFISTRSHLRLPAAPGR
jgi:hypothetical protein